MRYNGYMRSKIEGSIFGFLIGNALGFRCKNQALSSSMIVHQLPRYYSDAGAMFLCVMNSLLNSEKVNLEDIMFNFNEWYVGGFLASKEGIQSNSSISQSIRMYGNGMPPDRCGSSDSEIDNTALTYMLPIALWNIYENVEKTISDAQLVTNITNQQIEAQICSALYCLMIRSFLLGKREKTSQVLLDVYKSGDMKEYIEILDKIIIVPEHVSSTYDLLDSFWTTNKIFAKYRNNFEKALQEVIVLTNDCENNAALVGSLVGVEVGIEKIPKRWLDQLELTEEVRDIVGRFVDKIVDKNP